MTNTTARSTIEKKLISSYQRHLASSSTDDIEESSSSDDEGTSVDLDEYSDVNLIANIQNILFLGNAMNCSKCNVNGEYNFKVTKRLGLSYYISFTCSCGNVIRLSTGNRISSSTKTQMTDLNMLGVLAGSLVGIHRRGIQKFFGAMGILPPVQIEYYKCYEDLLHKSIEKVAEKSKETAADEARKYYNSNDITVSIDGTWLTQGFSSLHRVGTILSVADPPKVLDHEVSSRHCSECAGLLAVKDSDGELYSQLLEEHLKCSCEAVYEGSSGGMEGAAISDSYSFFVLLLCHLDGCNVWTISRQTQSALYGIHRGW
ncbi:unnamed protein product [Rotaria sp. Silwood2]|nr:unnamed protein product [Rotaria sp. Silwood2]